MPPRTLASLAHALTVSANPDAALLALGERSRGRSVRPDWRSSSFDERHGMLRERVLVTTSPDHVDIVVARHHVRPPADARANRHRGRRPVRRLRRQRRRVRPAASSCPSLGEPGWLSVRGIRYDGWPQLRCSSSTKSRKMFGARTAERFSPAIALFELAYLRLLEREAREEAVRTLEDVTQRVHGEYERDSPSSNAAAAMRRRRARARPPARVVALEREVRRRPRTRVARNRRADAVEQTVAAAVEQLEQAHVELHRRSESLRQKTRTIYLHRARADAGRVDRRSARSSSTACSLSSATTCTRTGAR